MRRPRHLRRGWLAADTMIGLMIVLLLTTALTTAIIRHRRASDRLAESRETVRLVEQTLIALQTAQAPPAAPAGVTVTVTPLESPAGLPRLQWIRVSAARGTSTSTLIGLVKKP